MEKRSANGLIGRILSHRPFMRLAYLLFNTPLFWTFNRHTIMKKIFPALLILSVCQMAWSQSANDRRGYQGTVTSAVTRTVTHEGQNSTKDEEKVSTEIQFSARSIVIGTESYDIVKKEFDGKSTTVFTCTKRRGTFEISYKVGESITVVDQSNKDLETVYLTLTEK